MIQPSGLSDGVLSDQEWETLLTSVPPALAQLVARLALQHGFRRGGRKLTAMIPERPEDHARIETR